jgi:hypothetical protein
MYWLPIILGATAALAASISAGWLKATSVKRLTCKLGAIGGGIGLMLFAFWAYETSSQLCPCRGSGVTVLFVGGVVTVIGGALLPGDTTTV